MEYDDARHIYTLNGVIIPSVTQILAPSSSYYTPKSAERGTLVHKQVQDYATKIMHNESGPFPSEPYLDSFALWCFAYNPTFLKIEEIVEGSIDGYRFAGRLDLIVEVNKTPRLIDVKTGVKAPWHHAQVAAYSITQTAARCEVLYLHNDMTYTEDVLTTSQLVEGIQFFRYKMREYHAKTQ
jgi:RecB family exonuclease